MIIAVQKLLHFIYLSYNLDQFFLNEELSYEDLLENAKVVWDSRPMWDDQYDFHS